MLNESNFLRIVCHRYRVVGVGVALGIAPPVEGGEWGHPKSGPADPAPRIAPGVRDLEGDRPDATESPVTVDRGYWQVEASFLSYTRDRQSGTTVETWSAAETNLKYGVLDSLDLQLIVSPWISETTETGGTRTTVSDFGDLTVRVKYNLWGNDEGKTALGLLPFVKIPTDTQVSNGRWEGGLVLPFAWRAGERWSLGMQAEVDHVLADNDRTMTWDFAHTAVLGLAVTDRCGIYLEYLGVAGHHPYETYFSNGVTFDLNDRTRLDVGSLIGLSRNAEDLTLFAGITLKF